MNGRQTDVVADSCLEQSHCLDHVPLVEREAVVNASGKNHEVPGIDCASDPLIAGILYPWTPNADIHGQKQV